MSNPMHINELNCESAQWARPSLDRLAGLIEINLLFAQAELVGGAPDSQGLARARRHIQEALDDLDAFKQGGAESVVSLRSGAA